MKNDEFFEQLEQRIANMPSRGFTISEKPKTKDDMEDGALIINVGVYVIWLIMGFLITVAGKAVGCAIIGSKFRIGIADVVSSIVIVSLMFCLMKRKKKSK